MGKKYLLTLCALLALIALPSCAANNDFTADSYSAIEEVTSITIDVEDRIVNVRESEDGSVHIDYFESSKEFYEISENNGTLSMQIKYNKKWIDFIGTKPSSEFRVITLYVPSEKLTSLSVTTTNEDITLSPIKAEDTVSLKSNGGAIRFTNLDAGNTINLDVRDANIDGSIVGSEDDFAISIDQKKGDSNIYPDSTGEKNLNLKANNGNINISFTN